MLGDDLTDEHAFGAAEEMGLHPGRPASPYRGAIPVSIGPRSSAVARCGRAHLRTSVELALHRQRRNARRRRSTAVRAVAAGFPKSRPDFSGMRRRAAGPKAERDGFDEVESSSTMYPC
jgi:hypothetical protein